MTFGKQIGFLFQVDIPVYQDCPITVAEGKLLLITASLKEDLSNKGFNNIIKVLNCFLPGFTHQSKTNLLKDIEINAFKMYSCCRKCYDIFEILPDKKTVDCSLCKIEYDVKTLH